MCLNNWGGINHKVLEFNEYVNLFSGKSGSGKSTVMDAIQVILYGSFSPSFLNKAADDAKNRRSVFSYLRGEQKDGSANRGNCDFCSVIALEIEDTGTHITTCVGIAFEVRKNDSEIKKFSYFSHSGKMPEPGYITEEVINAAKGAGLYSGFSKQINADEYVKRVEDNTIMDVLQRYEVNPGDVFFLPAGRVHAIGAGCFIAEIQQTSNITYRIYDYDRKGPDGKGRELHTELAKDAIDYTLYPDYRTHYKAHTNATVELAACKYFTTNLLDVDTIMVRDFSELDSFVVYICMEGKASIRDNKGNEIYIHQGQTVLIPADTDVVTISPVPGAKFMETYIG